MYDDELCRLGMVARGFAKTKTDLAGSGRGFRRFVMD
jgi:hypothetical protein